MTNQWARWLLPLIPALCAVLASRGLLHYFQLESYQFPGYFRTVSRNRVHAWLPGLCVTLLCVALYYLFDLLAITGGWNELACALALLAIAGVGGWLIAGRFAEKHAKKKFVYTGRVKRLYAVLVIVTVGLSLLLAQSPLAILPALWPLLLPVVVALAGLLAWPIEKLISEFYFRDARRKLLANPALIRIGITGSYGKTSVKHILGTILAEKYPTLITPASFNTPMGVSRAIREKLTPSYQAFIGEMGARHVGDIQEMCRLVRPTLGVITSVGPQHLDTFKTIERITKTKYELIDALPEDGHAFFVDDGAICRAMYERTSKPKSIASLRGGDADVWSENVTVSAQGSAFTLHVRGKGSVECVTKLLGEHSIQNILLAASVADYLGLSLKQIAHGVAKLEPVKARLELIAQPNSFTIINDAFNSNPIGSKAALGVLRQFPKRRIIITPGMVELGEREAEYNRELGKAIADAVDVAIIVGQKRAQPILDGLREAGFPMENAHRVDSLADSTALLSTIARQGDTVLYENDLPDNYQEA